MSEEKRTEGVTWFGEGSPWAIIGPIVSGSLIISFYLVDGAFVVFRSTVTLVLLSMSFVYLLLGAGAIRAIIFSPYFERKKIMWDAMGAVTCVYLSLTGIVLALWVAPAELLAIVLRAFSNS